MMTEHVSTFARPAALCLLALAVATAACGSDDDAASTGTPRDKAIAEVKAYVASNLDQLVSAAAALRAAAPAPDADGWNATSDSTAVNQMRGSWRQARQAYERVEGAIAVIFPELDAATDERYDGFLEDTGPDNNLFDDSGVTGVHAIERILWADGVRPEVEAFEKALPGYVAPSFPRTMAEARDFKDSLAARLEKDVIKMRDGWKGLALDPAAAYRGVISSMEEQLEKISLAATGEEESRYANETLADMRANIEGGKATARAFRAWLLASVGGAELEQKIAAGFARVETAYAAQPGPRLPPVPPSWSSVRPTDADLATDFGKLYGLLKQESDPESPGSLAEQMNAAAEAMGIPVLAP